MTIQRVLRRALTELAFAAGLLGLVGAAVAVMERVAPRQLQDLCLSAQAMTAETPLHWSCGPAPAAPGQPIGSP